MRFNQRLVFIGRHPAVCIGLAVLHPENAVGHIAPQQEKCVEISCAPVYAAGNQLRFRRLDAGLLKELADRSLHRSLAGLHAAAGNLPAPCVFFFRCSARHQETPVAAQRHDRGQHQAFALRNRGSALDRTADMRTCAVI